MSLVLPDRQLAGASSASGASASSCSCCRASHVVYLPSKQIISRSVIAHSAASALPSRQVNATRPSSRAGAALKTKTCKPLIVTASTGDAAELPTAGRLQAVLEGLDELNSKDPRSVEVDGQSVPYELAYARWLTDWVLQLCADAGRVPSEELRLAARGQHAERWRVPRSSYPEGRSAYLQWREDLKKQHAATTCRLMAAAGYPSESCRRVEQLILKRALREPEGQILEDALCLVFLERQFAEFLPKLAQGAGGDVAEAEAKMVDILQKSWKKMGELGRAAALKLPLEPRLAELVGRALAQ